MHKGTYHGKEAYIVTAKGYSRAVPNPSVHYAMKWCETMLGERGVNWQYITRGRFAIVGRKAAAMFKLAHG